MIVLFSEVASVWDGQEEGREDLVLKCIRNHKFILAHFKFMIVKHLNRMS